MLSRFSRGLGLGACCAPRRASTAAPGSVAGRVVFSRAGFRLSCDVSLHVRGRGRFGDVLILSKTSGSKSSMSMDRHSARPHQSTR